MTASRLKFSARSARGARWGVALLLAGHLTTSAAWAQIDFWVGGVGNWNAGGNWSSGIPNLKDAPQINNGGTAQLFDPGASIDMITMGTGPGNIGTLDVSGGRATITNGLYVANQGTGTLKLLNSGAVADAVGIIGSQFGSDGNATVESGATWTNSAYLDVGDTGNGTLSIDGGGQVSNTYAFIGLAGAGIGQVNVDGLGSKWTNSGDLAVGNSGVGTLAITGGGTVTNFNSQMGNNQSGFGVATVDGAGSKWTNNSVLAVGVFGYGDLSVSGGGAVTSTNGRVAREAGSTGLVSIDGTGSKWNCSGALTVGLAAGGSATLSVTNGGSVSAAGGVTNGPNGSVSGDGTIVANLENAGVLSPGAGIGTLHVTGNVQLDSNIAAKLQIELAAPASFDKLAVVGNVSLAGKLEVLLADDYVPHGSQSFDILDWTGSHNGTFSSISLPDLGGTLVWDTSKLYTLGVISVVGPLAVDGDYNGNGIVDAADYIVWRNTLGSTTDLRANGDNMGASANRIDQADYLIWKANFGVHFGSGASTSGAIPEPTTLMLFAMGFTIAGATADRTTLLRKVSTVSLPRQTVAVKK